MRIVTSYLFIVLFLATILQPTFTVFTGLITDSETSSAYDNYENTEKSEKSESESSEENSEFTDSSDGFFHAHSLFWFQFSKNRYLTKTILVSAFTDILIPPPKA